MMHTSQAANTRLPNPQVPFEQMEKNLPALETTHPSPGLNCPRCYGHLPDLFMINVCFKNGMLKAHSFFGTWPEDTQNGKLKPESYIHPSVVGFATEMTGRGVGGCKAMTK